MDRRVLIGLGIVGCAILTETVQGSGLKKASSDDVVVRKLEFVLPVEPENSKVDRVPWSRELKDAFADKPEEQRFSHVQTEAGNWTGLFGEYRESLVEKAKAQSLDSQSLDKCLDKVLEHSKGEEESDCALAYLPVGAYLARRGADAVWIVVVKWEYANLVTPEGEELPQSFGHTRVFAFHAKSLRLVGFHTCD